VALYTRQFRVPANTGRSDAVDATVAVRESVVTSVTSDPLFSLLDRFTDTGVGDSFEAVDTVDPE